jgi:hypothetical protein
MVFILAGSGDVCKLLPWCLPECKYYWRYLIGLELSSGFQKCFRPPTMGELKASGQESMKHLLWGQRPVLETSFSITAEIDFMSVAWLQLNPPPPRTNLWSRTISSAEEWIASRINDSYHKHDHYEMNCTISQSSVSLTSATFGKKVLANAGQIKFMFPFKWKVTGCYRGDRLRTCAIVDAFHLHLLRRKDTTWTWKTKA